MTLSTRNHYTEAISFIPFQTRLATSTITSTNTPGTAIATSLPIHNVDWIECVFTVGTHSVDLTYALDSTGYIPASGTITLASSATPYKVLIAVKGVPVTTGLGFGSHAITLKAVDATASGTVDGYIILHGHRLI